MSKPKRLDITEHNSINIREISSVYQVKNIVFVVMNNGNTFDTDFNNKDEFWKAVHNASLQ